MNFLNFNSMDRDAPRRRLAVAWLEGHDGLAVRIGRRKFGVGALLGRKSYRPAAACGSYLRRNRWNERERAFTILEMLLVVGIIGLLAAMALPHLGGFTKSNSMNVAARQLLDDVGLARQRALVNRSAVCMVFVPTNFWNNDMVANVQSGFTNTAINNLALHQCAAYATISLRSVGDQPGRSYPHYLTDWKFLPQGVFISPIQFSPGNPLLVSCTNTTTGLSNGWYLSPFPTNILFPFPSISVPMSNNLPYIEFNANGQLAAGSDQFIMLASGSIFYPPTAGGGLPFVDLVETPSGNETNNANLIHIDAVTGRAKIERNQF